ncbi:nitrogen regulation protein NR(I) [Limibacillus sp. MBR-115]|jgi:two-component system nitrogen regulation response regulator GlnG|uniref:nitrogen regulation protein NR(I) n=1 Tax=Limibacillus sp. MBR-115 TaxID=3156465 RepID=UPI00339307F6
MTGATILLADDDKAIRTVLSQALSRQGYDVRATGSGLALWQWVSGGDGDLVITDVVMPDENGLDLVPRIRKARPDLRVIVMSAQNTLLTAVKATERGAFEYLPKPFDLQTLVETVRRALASPGDDASLAKLGDGDEERLPLIGRSPAMQEIYRVLARLMGTDLTVMIFGESGTGKELVARALHDYGKRKEGPFIALNMAAIPRELIESELFGHEKGAFTGATQRSAGRFEQAKAGTLFLDEIGDMPLDAQTRLLRVLQEGEYTTVGGRQPIKADVRIIAATHRDLRQMVRAGQFREDLYYRLNVVPIRIPPLRERSEDIPELVRHFFNLAHREGLPLKSPDPAGMAYLKNYPWPGNVRELENLTRRLAALYTQEIIDLDIIAQELTEQAEQKDPASMSELREESLSDATERHLRQYFEAHEGSLPASGLYERVLQEVERPLIELSLAATKGNQIRAAQLLGLNRNTLRKKIRDLDIQVVRSLKYPSGGIRTRPTSRLTPRRRK